ncbi:efflux RND transporter permease subunit [Cupriavidus basilensis]
MQADDLNELRAWDPKHQAGPHAGEIADRRQHRYARQGLADLSCHRSRQGKVARHQPERCIDNALNNAFGQRQVSTIYNPLNQYRVVMEAAPQYWQNPDGLRDIYLITSTGAQVPLSTFSHYEPTNTRAGSQPPGPVRGEHDLVQPGARGIAVGCHAGYPGRDEPHRRAILRAMAASRAPPRRSRICSRASPC